MTAEVYSLGEAASAAGSGARIVTVLGSRDLAQVVRSALSIELPAGERPLTAIGARGTLLLAVGAVDSRVRASAVRADAALSGAVQLASAVVLVVRLSDVGRPSASGLTRVAAALQEGAAAKRLIVVVANYESEECTEEEVDGGVRHGLQDLPDDIDLHVVCVPPRGDGPHKFDSRLAGVAQLLQPGELAPYGVVETPEDVVARMEAAMKVGAAEMGSSERELAASYVCAGRSAAALDRFRAAAREWRGTVDGGRIVGSFGSEAKRAMEAALGTFDEHCAAYADSRAMERLRARLQATMVDEAYVLYVRQVGKLKEVAYQLFRQKLGRVRINDRVERAVRAVMGEADKYFYDKAALLRADPSWRCDATRAELRRTMREDSKERLQLARLQGNYVPSFRAPLMVAFHTLLAAPFGKDSRIGGHPQAEEMQTKFDPDKVKKAALLRNRPYPTRYKIGLGSGEAMPPDALEVLDQFFEK